MTDVYFYPSPPQEAVLNARTPLILDMAGQGGGKTELIGIISSLFIRHYPNIKGFIGANTYTQLSQTTLEKTFTAWRKYQKWEEFNKENPHGQYVVDRKPPPHFVRRFTLKSYKNVISFVNGCIIYVGSLENYKAHDGKEFGWAHLDETKDSKEVAIKEVILGRLRQRGIFYDQFGKIHYFESGEPEPVKGLTLTAWQPCYIHTSPTSAGTDWLNKLFKLDDYEKEILDALSNIETFFYKVDKTKTVIIYQSDWNRLHLPDNFLDNRRADMSEDEALMMLGGYPFAKTGNEYFPEFSRRKHVVDKIEIDFNKRLHVAYDFNIMPYVTQIVSQIDYVVRYYNPKTREKKIFLEDSDAGAGFEAINVMRIKVAREFLGRAPRNDTALACEDLGLWLSANGFSGDVAVYGDATGHNRITGLPTLTQFKIIERSLGKFAPVDVQADRKNIAPLMRRKLVRRILGDKYPTIEVYIDKSCDQTIRDFEFLKTVPEGKFKEKKKDKTTDKFYEVIGHTSDALEGFLSKILKHLIKDLD